MELIRYDSNGPEIDSGVASFEILDPDLASHTKNTYCIGFKFLGGDPLDPQNWKYNHAHYYNRDTVLYGDVTHPTIISKDALDITLSRHSTKVKDLLLAYINIVYSNQ